MSVPIGLRPCPRPSLHGTANSPTAPETWEQHAPSLDQVTTFSTPLSSEHVTHKTVKARIRPWLSGRIPLKNEAVPSSLDSGCLKGRGLRTSIPPQSGLLNYFANTRILGTYRRQYRRDIGGVLQIWFCKVAKSRWLGHRKHFRNPPMA